MREGSCCLINSTNDAGSTTAHSTAAVSLKYSVSSDGLLEAEKFLAIEIGQAVSKDHARSLVNGRISLHEAPLGYVN